MKPVSLTLYNTLTRRKEAFAPLDPENVRMYVCGPTVYDYAHIGNARPVIVFDVLYRLLRHVYGATHVTYARNFTDVDDKINKRAFERWSRKRPLREEIRLLTDSTIAQYHADVDALGCLRPTHEPRATDFVCNADQPTDIVRLIEQLIARGHAYAAEGHVLFHVPSMPSYGRLAQRSAEDMLAGARVDVAPYKRDPMDFVLWKPSDPELEPAWPSPWGLGRPGWHIECSAMAGALLGAIFDIHAGGIDLMFPHHENEIAQSCCANGTERMANIWMHNGFLMVEGEKMSKSLGNFITIHDLLATEKFGNQRWHGRVLRFAMLATHYRQPIDWTVDRLVQARSALQEFAAIATGAEAGAAPNAEVIAALSDDLNTPSAISILHGIAKSARRGDAARAAELRATLEFMALWGGEKPEDLSLAPKVEVDAAKVDSLVQQRLAARRAKDFKESDRIRDELAGMGIAIKDSKDPRTGEPTTTWEVKS